MGVGGAGGEGGGLVRSSVRATLTHFSADRPRTRRAFRVESTVGKVWALPLATMAAEQLASRPMKISEDAMKDAQVKCTFAPYAATAQRLHGGCFRRDPTAK